MVLIPWLNTTPSFKMNLHLKIKINVIFQVYNGVTTNLQKQKNNNITLHTKKKHTTQTWWNKISLQYRRVSLTIYVSIIYVYVFDCVIKAQSEFVQKKIFHVLRAIFSFKLCNKEK